ncbi:hypothetical protein AYO49_04470 [Verrucomicrobiaceae bacterium SCGC AG-212-N21]|nr:hypothetical protein AYO49_04470 [Verrucomicrobiaceae bacterium SCGC AG-212-N21]
MKDPQEKAHQQSGVIAGLHIALGQHRLSHKAGESNKPEDRKWKRKEVDLIRRLAREYAQLARLRGSP